MNQPIALGPPLGSAPAPAARTSPTRKRPVCRVATTSGVSFQGAIESLLHHRLRLVSLVVLMPVSIFLVRNLIDSTPSVVMDHLMIGLQIALTVTTSLAVAVVWCRRTLSLRWLRAVELLLFGSLTVCFAWMQYDGFRHGTLIEPTDYWHEADSVRQAVSNTAVRWVLLIVVYGVFIPNTWRRCALIVSLIALAPLILTPVGASLHGQLPREFNYALLDLATLLLTAVAVAVFGTYRLRLLQEEAFQAQQLGQYRLLQRLGGGGMGEVYLAEHLLLRRPCALKLIRPEQAGDPTNLERFEREVQAMANLTHWNTVEVFDYGRSEDGTFYYVMEYLPGPNLERLVARHGPLPADRAIHFLRQVCRALREAHAVGLLHRDIKPSNIIVCERGGVFDVAKLLDFGLVQEARTGQETGRLTLQGVIVGSPPYMSPEQAAGKALLDVRSDVYSLGAVAYYLLTGQPPFPRETAMLMLMAHAYDPVIRPTALRPDVPPDLEAVVLKCLEKKPEQRFANIESVEHALAACRDADRWTEEQATVWWKERHNPDDNDIDSVPDVPTQVLAIGDDSNTEHAHSCRAEAPAS
jgi:serine/threonine protein kinase